MGNSHRNMNDQYVLLNSTNKVETSEPNGCHLFYLNTKCEEKKPTALSCIVLAV